MSELKVDGTEKAKDVKLVHISRESVREVRLFFLTEAEREVSMDEEAFSSFDVCYEIKKIATSEGWTVIGLGSEAMSIPKSEDVMIGVTLMIPFEGNAQEKRLWEVLEKIATVATSIKKMIVIAENVMHEIEVERK